MNKPQTLTINAAYKEFYYQVPVREAEEIETKQNDIFWNYMLNVSMQNTIALTSRK